MTSGAYGERLGEYVGVEAPPVIRTEFLPTAEFAMTRLRWNRRAEPVFTHIEAEDAYLVFLQRRSIPANPYWVDGRAVAMDPLQRGEFLLIDLHTEHESIVEAAVDCIAIYVPRAALASYADQLGGRRVDMLRAKPGAAIRDPVIWHLSEAILPAMEQPELPSRLMVDYAGIALLAHLTETYGEGGGMPASARGRLSPWQARRARDRMMDDLSDSVSLEEIARECGLSRSHFAHAFKATAGVAPHQWRMRRRIARAKELLLKSSLSVEEVAAECGFADQSHFTRTFARMVGKTPGRWRREWRF